MNMESDILYEESQYLGYNRLSFLRRMVLALFCFLSYYWSGNSVDAEGSGSLFFFLGVAIIGVSAILVFILHYRTRVENGSLILDGLWTARKVKIDLSSIKDVSKVKYSRFFFNRAVYNLHLKGAIHFYTRGKECIQLTDKDGLKYLIGSQNPTELLRVLNEQIKNNHEKISFCHYISVSNATFSQIFNPVEWEFSKEDLGGGEYELVFKASIEDGWYLYSQFVEDDGPLPTTFTFFESDGYELIGTTQEGEPKQEYDPNFDMVLSYFTKEAVFSQKVKAISPDAQVDGELMFMVCDATQCLPPEYVDFSYTLGSASEQVETKDVDDEESTSSLNLVSADTEESENESSNRKGMWSIFFIAFLSGFAALLTPCVFPMIPMTVSYFTKQSKSRAKGISNAIIYGISIIIIYVGLGVGVSAAFGPEVLNSMATNAYFNIAFFVLLVVFAASFLGAFDLTLPHSWINKADKASDRGGFIGIFFMALVLALVSFSCTGPIVGTLLVEAASGVVIWALSLVC